MRVRAVAGATAAAPKPPPKDAPATSANREADGAADAMRRAMKVPSEAAAASRHGAWVLSAVVVWDMIAGRAGAWGEAE
jgi:hypothetical protein